MHKSGIISGLVSGGINTGLSICKEGVAFTRGEQELGEAVTNVAIAGAKGYAVGYTTTALSKGMTHVISHYLGEGIAKNLSKTNAPIAIVNGIINVSKSMVSYLKGEMDKELIDWNPDKYVMDLNKINEQFGTILPFKTFTEFDNFMLSDEALDF